MECTVVYMEVLHGIIICPTIWILNWHLRRYFLVKKVLLLKIWIFWNSKKVLYFYHAYLWASFIFSIIKWSSNYNRNRNQQSNYNTSNSATTHSTYAKNRLLLYTGYKRSHASPPPFLAQIKASPLGNLTENINMGRKSKFWSIIEISPKIEICVKNKKFDPKSKYAP